MSRHKSIDPKILEASKQIEYALLQEEWFSSLFEESFPSPSYGAIWWFLVKTPPEALKGYLKKWFRACSETF